MRESCHSLHANSGCSQSATEVGWTRQLLSHSRCTLGQKRRIVMDFIIGNKWPNFRRGVELTVRILEGLLLFGWFWYHFDPLAVKEPDVLSVAVKHFYREHKVLSLIRIWYVQSFGCTIWLKAYTHNYSWPYIHTANSWLYVHKYKWLVSLCR